MVKSKGVEKQLIGGCLDITAMIKTALNIHWWSSEEKSQLAVKAVQLYRLCLQVERAAKLSKLLEKLPANKNMAKLAIITLRTIATALIATGREDAFFRLIGASASTSWCPESQRCFRFQAYGLIPGYLESVRKRQSPMSFGEIVGFRKALVLIFGEAELVALPFDFSILGFSYWGGVAGKRKKVVEQDFIYMEWIITNFHLTEVATALRTKGIEVALESLIFDYQIVTVAREFSDSRLLEADERLQLVVDKYLGYRQQAPNNLLGTSLTGLFFQVLQYGLARAHFPIILDVFNQFYDSPYWRDFHWWLGFDRNPKLLKSLKQGLKLVCYRRRQYNCEMVTNLPIEIVRLFGYPNQIDSDEVSKMLYQALEAVYQETEGRWLGPEDWRRLLDDWKLDGWLTLGLNVNNATYQKIIDRIQEYCNVSSNSNIHFWMLVLAESVSARKLWNTYPQILSSSNSDDCQ